MKYNPYCNNLITKIFDIETTGLYPQNDRIISASFINPDGSDLIQYFCEAPQHEDIVVEQIIKELSKCDVIITYNGNMFDIPFIQTRAKKLHVVDKLPIFWALDIYRYLKTYWPQAQRMESLRQKAVEFALGLESNRIDEIDGAECIQLYRRYVDWNEEDAKNLILLHNGDDVRQLAMITEKINFLPFHQIAFEKGFGSRRFVTTESKLSKSKFSTKAKALPGSLPADIYTDGYHLCYETLTGDITLDIPLQRHDNMAYVDLKKIVKDDSEFIDLQNYNNGYLILERDGINYKECNMLAKKIISSIA